MDGILIIDKPAGITSHDVVARVRRILQTKRVGHTGTLDPFATGALVILVGQATRLAQFLDKDAKEYEATVRLGFETDTGDATGKISDSKFQIPDFKDGKSGIWNLKSEIEGVLQDFRGEILQTPPMYSAKKIAGVKLYELARQGIEIERKAVKVKIYELEVLPRENNLEFGIWNPESETFDFGLRVACSAGTYIRTLAEDIGRKLGIGAHLAALRRTRAGKFSVENSAMLEELERIARAGSLERILISPNDAVAHLPEIKLQARDAAKVKNGMRLGIDLPETSSGDFVRLAADENLIAVGVYDGIEKAVQPKVVLL